VFVARSGVAELTNTDLTSDEVRDLVERMLKPSGRRVDLSSPLVNGAIGLSTVTSAPLHPGPTAGPSMSTYPDLPAET
jgi:Flp pilus assembly CpaF family ATPase